MTLSTCHPCFFISAVSALARYFVFANIQIVQQILQRTTRLQDELDMIQKSHRPCPSAMLLVNDTAARRIWLANPKPSKLGSFLLTPYITFRNSRANLYTSKSSNVLKYSGVICINSRNRFNLINPFT